MVTTQAIFVRLAAFMAAFALTIAPSDAVACTPAMSFDIKPNRMKQKCRQALLNPDRFLERIKKGKLKQENLTDFVIAFDDGEYGCKENNEFTFRILKSYYSFEDRKLSDPAFLERYALNFPDSYGRAEQSYVSGLIWLFARGSVNLPNGWTADQARTFVEMPKHWSIALAKFGGSNDRDNAVDDAVFASVIDPQSRYFDRQLASRLAGFSSRNRLRRRISAASLFIDPRFGPTDFVKAEELLPVPALYYTENPSQIRQEARAVWVRVVDAYIQSSTPAVRDKGLRLRAKMLPPTSERWPSFEPRRDGRVWLSLNDWPRSIPNPFASVRSLSLLAAEDYPPSAHRNDETGSLTLGVRFGPDGKFSALDVLQSSASTTLDEAAVKIVLRRFRPRLTDMTLEGHHGREVMVPLLVVNWEISSDFDDASDFGISHYANGTFSVVAPHLPRLRIGC